MNEAHKMRKTNMNRHISTIFAALLLAPLATLQAAEYHVALTGSDASPGTPAAPLRTIQSAADLAQPGDTVTVHAGVYRERVNPPRGGESDARRIVYQAAPGEKVVITGSEEVKKWEKVRDGVWKATLPNTFFGTFNPFAEVRNAHHEGVVPCVNPGDEMKHRHNITHMNPSRTYRNTKHNLPCFWLAAAAPRSSRKSGPPPKRTHTNLWI
jgi:hypothetical protein